jgi:hypothetical protein
MSVKERVLQAIRRLPDDIDFCDVADEIACWLQFRTRNATFRPAE